MSQYCQSSRFHMQMLINRKHTCISTINHLKSAVGAVSSHVESVPLAELWDKVTVPLSRVGILTRGLFSLCVVVFLVLIGDYLVKCSISFIPVLWCFQEVEEEHQYQCLCVSQVIIHPQWWAAGLMLRVSTWPASQRTDPLNCGTFARTKPLWASTGTDIFLNFDCSNFFSIFHMNDDNNDDEHWKPTYKPEDVF